MRNNLILIFTFFLCMPACALPQQVPVDTVGGWVSFEAEKTRSLAWGDLDNDGDLDLAVGNWYGRIKIYMNENGVLDTTAGWSSSVSGASVSLAWGDVDGDGYMDLACGNEGMTSPNMVYFNSLGIMESVPGWISDEFDDTQDIAWADFDEDGDLDLAAANRYGVNRIYINHSGTLETAASWVSLEADDSHDLGWGDADGDGDLDLVCGNRDAPDRIYFNNSGILETAAAWSTDDGSETLALALGDVDRDGDLDLVCCGFIASIRLYFNNDGVINTQAGWMSTDNEYCLDLSLGDVNGDNFLDLACGTTASDKNKIYLNLGGVFESTPSWSSQDQMDTHRLAWGDFDGDGDLDLACANSGTPEVGQPAQKNRIYINHSGILESAASWSSQESGYTRCLDWTDIDYDGDPDLVCGGSGLVPNRIYYNNNGVLGTSADLTFQENSTTLALAPGDVNGDGYPELACSHDDEPCGGPTRVYFNYNGVPETMSSWVEPAKEFGCYDVANALAWGDIDNDGDPDLASGTVGKNKVYINNSGVLDTLTGWISSENAGTGDISWVDVDKDGDLDLSCGNSGTNRIYFNQNGILDTMAGWVSLPSSDTRAIAWGDVDGDGDLDMVCGNYIDSNRVYFNDGGVLNTVPGWASSEADWTYDVTLEDIDNDGDLDLICAGEDAVKLYYNHGGMLGVSGIILSAGKTMGLAWGDIDSDGDFDLAEGLSYAPDRIFFNNRMTDCPQEYLLPNTPACLGGLELLNIDSSTGLITLGFDLYDGQSDSCMIIPEYSPLGGGLWYPAVIYEDLSRLASSPAGERHIITWDADSDQVDGYDILFRLKVLSNPDFTGVVQHPAMPYYFSIGRVDSRPKVSLLYPTGNAVTTDTVPILGKIWDATNFDYFEIRIGKLPDTSSWEILYSSPTSQSLYGHLITLDLSGHESGNYVMRTIATDQQQHVTVVDRLLKITDKPLHSPSVINNFPTQGADNVPCNSPVVVKFDMNMNQAFINTQTFNLFSSSGERYKDAVYDFSSRTLTLNPFTNYSPSQFHYSLVSADFQSQAGVPITGDYVSGFTTSEAAPAVGVKSIYPLRAEVGVSQDAIITIEFEKASPDKYITVFSLEGDTLVMESVSYDPSTYTWTLTPQILLPKTYYIIRVSDDSDFSGEADYMSYFITEDAQMPVVVDYAPEDDAWLIGLNETISATLNKPINTHTVDSASFYILGPSGAVPGFIGFGSVGDSIITFDPLTSFQSSTRYQVVLTSHIQDHIGNSIDSLSWSFTTGTFGTVGYDGEIISSGNLELVFPVGSVSSESKIGIGFIPPDKITVAPEMNFTGLAFDLEASTDLEKPAVLTISLPDSVVLDYGPPEQLKIFRYDLSANEWVYKGGSSYGSRITVSLGEFGRYGVFKSSPGEVLSDLGASLSLVPRIINPSSSGVNSRLNVSFTLSRLTDVVAKIYDTRGKLVKTLAAGYPTTVGDNIIEWDGRGNDGRVVNDGLYILYLEAEGKHFQKTFGVINK
ncbi:MAG: VCBS repeat-containing protein [Candidatus Zixiibacteriota bacterium]|nr:MAG: VCBS repeat-containing protein [candidate division Zixibacteria bacterium]